MAYGKASPGQLFEMASVLVRHVPAAFADMDAATLQGWIDGRTGAVAKALRSAFVPPISSEQGEVAKPVTPATPLDDTYRITVNRDQKFEAMVKAGKYDRVDKGTTEAHFPLRGSGTEELEGVLVPNNRYIDGESALVGIDNMGLRPADFQELCAFGAEHPNVQLKFDIVELASVWLCRGARYVAYLRGHVDKRDLNIGEVADDWVDCYFLAFPKTQS